MTYPNSFIDTTYFQYNPGLGLQPDTITVNNALGYQAGASHLIPTADDVVAPKNFNLSSHGVWYEGYNGNFALSR